MDKHLMNSTLKHSIASISKQAARLSCLIGIVSLLSGMLLSVVHLPASAASSTQAGPIIILEPVKTEAVDPAPSDTPVVTPACTPPDDWDKTVRLKDNRKPFHEWHFKVTEPEMDITIEYFWYQDYNPSGCPFDCSAGDCQDDETGEGESPLGSVSVSDGNEGANSGREQLHGRLGQGDYIANFRVTGRGSINIGVKVKQRAAPTDTPEPPPTDTPEPTFTPTATEELPTITSTPTATGTLASPTPTGSAAPPTVTPTGTVTNPSPTPTATPENTTTISPPPATETATATNTQSPPGPTATPQVTHNPPSKTKTPTPTPEVTDKPPKYKTPTTTPGSPIPTWTPVPTDSNPQPTPPATMGPPTPPAGTALPPILIPVTGADLTTHGLASNLYPHLFINLGIGLLGLGLIFHRVSRRLGEEK